MSIHEELEIKVWKIRQHIPNEILNIHKSANTMNDFY